MFITIGLFTALYSISLFLPTIIKELGYSANQAQLMTVPVYFIACACTITGSFFSDRMGQRGPFLLGFELCAITGFIMLIGSDKPHIQYAGTFFAASGRSFASSCLPSLILIHRYLPLYPLDGFMEQQQHRWYSKAWCWYCNASWIWKPWGSYRWVCLSFDGSTEVRQYSMASIRYTCSSLADLDVVDLLQDMQSSLD